METWYRITYINEAGFPCEAAVKDVKYYYWTSKRNIYGKYEKVEKSLVGKFLKKLKKCSNIDIKPVEIE